MDAQVNEKTRRWMFAGTIVLALLLFLLPALQAVVASAR